MLCCRAAAQHMLNQRVKRGLNCALCCVLVTVFTLVPLSSSGQSRTDGPGAELLRIARDGTPGELRRILASPTDVNWQDTGGVTALHVASASCRTDIVELLLVEGAIVDSSTKDGSTPLILATRRGCETVALRLLAAGAEADRPTLDGHTAASWAAGLGLGTLEAAFKRSLSGRRRLAALRPSCDALLRYLDASVTSGPDHLSGEDRRNIDGQFVFGSEQPVLIHQRGGDRVIIFRNLSAHDLQAAMKTCSEWNPDRLITHPSGSELLLELSNTRRLRVSLWVSDGAREFDEVRNEWVVGKSRLNVQVRNRQ